MNSGSSFPKVSIGLPVYNGEGFLEEALDSLLAQSFPDFELLLLDNASGDLTEVICRQYARRDSRIRYTRHTHNLGAAENYNRAFHLSKGEYFKWAAHDDLCAPSFIQQCLDALEQAPEAVCCYPLSVLVDGDGGIIEHYADQLDLREPAASQRFQRFLKTPGWCHPVFGLIRRDALARTGLIGNFPRSDRNLIGELALRGEIIELQEYLFYRRIHPKISTRVHPTERSLAVWFDPANQGRLVLPRARRFYEYVKSILRVDLPLPERLQCLASVCLYMLYPRRWQGFLDDFLSWFRKENKPAAQPNP